MVIHKILQQNNLPKSKDMPDVIADFQWTIPIFFTTSLPFTPNEVGFEYGNRDWLISGVYVLL